MFTMSAPVVFHWVVWAVLAQLVVVFGVISNIINIICFVKQGFKDSINVSLTGLAISDIGCLLPLIWTNLCYTPAFGDLDLPFEVSEFQSITSGMTHVMFTRISSWITAVITLERCLCVTIPLKVKEVATPKRTLIIIISIFVVLIAGASPQYYYYKPGKKYFPDRNKTLLGIIYSRDLVNFETFSYYINIVLVQSLAFVTIIICTSILVTELNVKTNWRKKSVATENVAKLTSSNKKVAKMVVMISVLFIASFIIIIVIAIAINVIPGFSLNGKFRHLVTVIGGVGFFSESVNASMNIFIYYHMSSKYRDTLNKTLFRNQCVIKDNNRNSYQRNDTVREQ